MKSLRITFVQCVNRVYADTQMFGVHFMPVWAYTLAAHVSNRFDSSIQLFDNRFDSLDQLQESDLFFFTGINQDKEAILEMQKAIRNRFPNSVIAIGGPISWSFDKAEKIRDLWEFDHIFIGDGEELLVDFLASYRKGVPLSKVIRAPKRFELSRALPMHQGLLDSTFTRYYGGVLEVSRGCPFLCEFCDIRTLPDNNRSHVKAPELIVEELDHLTFLGIKQILFACDNFIGNPSWAEQVCDQIIAWRMKTGRKLSIYTWLTINVSRTPRLLRKLREAGFDMFFIGVESFNRNSLLETAKIQNTTLDLEGAIREIQSYGFIVVGGLIFGFDTDPDNIVEITLNGILKSGMISGDPSLLTALPGTPLHRRMALSGRLRDGKLGLGGFKYQTNIKYLRNADLIKLDFKRFVEDFNRGSFQFQRLLNFYSCLNSPHYIPPLTMGYGDLKKLMSICLRESFSLKLLLKRVVGLFQSRERSYFIARAILYTFTKSRKEKPLWPFFKFWLFNWSNSVLKYGGLDSSDFDIDSVSRDFDRRNILPEGYEDFAEPDTSPTKNRSQLNATTAALKAII